MFKKLAVAASIAAALVISPNVAAAQATDPYPATDPGICLLTPSVFANATPTKCYGFFGENGGVQGFSTGQTVSSTQNKTAWDALQAFGFNSVGPYSVIEKNNWNGTSNFATQLIGWTVVGIHWGNYPNSLDNGTDIGNVSAFYLFDAGAGTKDINLASTQGVSNYAVIYTNGECTDTRCGPTTTSVVPEPSTYALMASGLLGIFGFARRRRNNA